MTNKKVDENGAEVRDVAIPHDVVVRCPLADFDLTPALACDGCQYLHGLAELYPEDTTIPFHRKFAVQCKYPTDRELQRVVFDEVKVHDNHQ